MLADTARARPCLSRPIFPSSSIFTFTRSGIRHIEQRARLFHDEIDAKLASETNRQLYRLSVLTALFLPAALIAGLFGMNLEGIPWTGVHYGFWLAAALAVASSIGTWLFLRYLDRD